MRENITKGMSAELTGTLRVLQRNLHDIDDSRRGESKVISDAYMKMASGVSKRMGMQGPDEVIVAPEYINASAGNWKGRRVLTVYPNISRVISEKGQEALMAHEMAHIYNDHSERNGKRYGNFRAARLMAMGCAIGYGNFIEQVWNIHSAAGMAGREGMILVFGLGARYVADQAIYPVLSMLKRRDEKVADAASVKIAGVAATVTLLNALDPKATFALDRLLEDHPVRNANIRREDGRLHILSSFNGALSRVKERVWAFRYRTHPSVDKRVEYAIKYAKRHGIDN